MELSLYCYRAIVRSVYDGDTCTADIDLGLNTWVHGEKLRLNRIDTPELRGIEREQGLPARDFVREKIEGKEVMLQTIKDRKGKYGRFLAEIWMIEPDGQYVNLNDMLLELGYAQPYGV